MIIQVRDTKRGENMVRLKQQNREKIKNWFLKHPGSSVKECAAALGLCTKTVRNHIKALEKEGLVKYC